MSIVTELIATITAKIDGFKTAMQDGAKHTEGFATAWTRAGADVSAATMRIGAAVGTLSVGVVGYAAKMGVAFNSMREDALTEFTVMLKDAEKAKNMLDELKAVSDKTPFESGDLNNAARMLMNYGVAGDAVIPIIKRLGDASGGNVQKFQQITLAYSQMSSMGRLMGQDLLQMTQAGFNPLHEISQRTGESMRALKKRMEDGRISIAEVDQALVAATSQGGKFYGLMDEKSKTLTGLLSTMREKVKTVLGNLFDPLSDGFKQAVQSILQNMEGDQLTAWMQSMQKAVASVVSEIQQFAASNGKQAIQAIGDAFLYGAKGASELIKWLRESGPAILAAGREWLKYLEPIRQWIVENPKMVAGFVAVATAVKALQFVGVISGLTSMVGVLRTAISVLAGFPAMLGAAGGAMGALSTGGLAIIIAGAAALFMHLQHVRGEFDKLEKHMKEGSQHSDKLRRKEDERRSKLLEAGASGAERQSILRNELDMAKKNKQGAESALSGAENNAANMPKDISWREKAAYQKVADQDVSEAKQQYDRAEAWVKQLEAELKMMSVQSGAEMGKAASDAIQESAAVDGKSMVDEVQREKIDKSLAQHRNDATESEYHGYDKIRDFVGMGGTKDDVQQFAASQKGVSPKMAEAFAQLYEESDKSAESLDELSLSLAKQVKANAETTKRTEATKDKLEDFSEKMSDLRGQLSPKELQGFRAQFNQLGKDFVDKKIDADQYRDSLKNLTNRIKDSQQVSAETKGLDDTVSKSRRQFFDMNHDGTKGYGKDTDMVNDKTRLAAFAKFDQFEAEGKKLGEAFKANAISASQYSKEMDRLKKATDDVTDAAMREEQEKRRQALLRGDFKGAGLDFGKAVEDKMADQMMRQFDQSVTDFIAQFVPLTQITQTVNDGLTSLTDGIAKFDTGLQKAQQPGGSNGSQNDAEAFQAYANFANSIQGQIAGLWNLIAQHMQTLQIVFDPTRIQQEQDAIKQLTDQIRLLNKSVSTFNGYRSYDPIFKDPGISGASSGSTHHNNVSITLPNVLTTSQGEIDYLAQQVSASMSRQGGSSFAR